MYLEQAGIADLREVWPSNPRSLGVRTSLKFDHTVHKNPGESSQKVDVGFVHHTGACGGRQIVERREVSLGGLRSVAFRSSFGCVDAFTEQLP